MTIEEIIELFKHEMYNELFHNCTDDILLDTLIRSVDDVCKTISDTYEANEKNK